MSSRAWLLALLVVLLAAVALVASGRINERPPLTVAGGGSFAAPSRAEPRRAAPWR